jgi:8-oxo-dGTP diphosphatase
MNVNSDTNDSPLCFEILNNISVNCVIFGYDNHQLKVLVYRRDIPYRGILYLEWELPGSHVRRCEGICHTANRVLKEQTRLENIFVKQFMVFSDPDRLKLSAHDYEWAKTQYEDDRIISVGFYSLININDQVNKILIEEAKWVNVYEIKELMFDHKSIIDEALKKLRYDLLHEPLVFELLPEKFTLTQMQGIYEAIFNTTFDKRNYRRKVNKMPYLIPLNETESGVSHKPARMYCFDRDIYEKTRTVCFDFII